MRHVGDVDRVGFETIEQVEAYFGAMRTAFDLKRRAGEDFLREMTLPEQMTKFKTEKKITFDLPKLPSDAHRECYLRGLQEYLRQHFGSSRATLAEDKVQVIFSM